MACKSCINSRIKGIILAELPDLEPILAGIPDCKEDEMIKFCPSEGGTGGKRTKRAPSKYNIFIGTCMKTGKGMKECAAEYRGRQT